MADAVGAVIERGVSDWQIFQQQNGAADMAVSGRWGSTEKNGKVEVRLVRENTGVPVAGHLDWTPCQTGADGTWSGVLKGVPAGGLYRLESHYWQGGNVGREWAQRGDVRHFLGVGDLWVIAGQSNSAGYGRGPYTEPLDLDVHVLNNAMRWALAAQPLNESTDSAHPANSEAANSAHSPWLHWARLVKAELGYPVGLVQTSLGGSPLSQWNPTEEGSHSLYEILLQAVAAVGGKVRGVLWYQGESDCSPAAGPTYEDRFMAMVGAWRKNLHCPDLHVLTVQLGRLLQKPSDEGDLYWSVVRQAQRNIPQRDKEVSVVTAVDLPLSDTIHISPYGNLLLAERAAKTVLAAHYGKKVDALSPEPVSAKRDAAGKTIEIVFANVTSRLESFDSEAMPFRVEDEAGVVPVEKVQYTFSEKVQVQLQRPLKGRAVVHGGYGIRPDLVPHDMVRQMPMLAFMGVKVE